MFTSPDFWILEPFNLLFFLLMAAFILLLIISSLALKKSSEDTRRNVLCVACIITLIGYFIYKHALSLDKDYNVITANMGGFTWWGELPFQLCNINMILIPIAIWRKSRPLLSFCFFVGPLGALMALLMPGNGFSGYSLLLPRMLGYHFTHFMIMIEGLAIGTFRLYRPVYKDIPKTLLMGLLVLLGVTVINLLLRWTNLHPKSNYFFAMETEGNPLLELFYKWIPVPCLYVIPAFAIIAIYMLIVITGFVIADKLKKK